MDSMDLGASDLHVEQTPNGDRATMAVTMFNKTVENKRKSAEAERPVYDYQPYISIKAPGQKNTEFIGPLKEEHKERFPEIYKKFRDGVEGEFDGTPLEEWGLISRTRCIELRALKIQTVEMLAGVPDINIQKIGLDGMDLRKKARLFLEGRSDTEVALEEAEKRIKELETRLIKLESQQVQAEAAKASPKRRKRKTDEPTNDSTGQP